MANQMGGLANALRKTADQLDEQQQTSLSGYASSFAQSLDSMASSLHDKDMKKLLSETQDLARRQAAVFLGGAIATGFILARFLKSSAQPRPAESQESASSPLDSTVYPPYRQKGEHS